MTTYNHIHPGSSIPFTRPQRARPVTYRVAWKDLIAILAAAAFVIATFAVIFDAADTASVPATAVHHGGAHGRADVLFRQRVSGPIQAMTSGVARRGSFGRSHWLHSIGGGVVASSAGIAGEQLSGPMTLDKQRLARHDSGRYVITTMNWGGVASTASVTIHQSRMRPPKYPVTGGRTLSQACQGPVVA